MPISAIEDFVERLRRSKRRDQNLAQVAIAQYAAAKFSTEEKPYNPNRLLPWPPEQLADQGKTLKILQELVDAEVLPSRAHSAAMNRLRK